jgi:hypothetical protein
VTVVRQDGSGKARSISALELTAYENDVLSVLARSHGPPRGDVVIQRGPAGREVRVPLRIQPGQEPRFKPEDVILKSGDIILIQEDDESVRSRAAEPERPAAGPAMGPVAVTLAVAAPDGRVLVEMPGGAWKLFDAAKLFATDTDGKPVAAVADRLKAMTAVLVATDGKPPAAQYLQLVKPGTLVIVIKD